jgi:hypothetical protein
VISSLNFTLKSLFIRYDYNILNMHEEEFF